MNINDYEYWEFLYSKFFKVAKNKIRHIDNLMKLPTTQSILWEWTTLLQSQKMNCDCWQTKKHLSPTFKCERITPSISISSFVTIIMHLKVRTFRILFFYWCKDVRVPKNRRYLGGENIDRWNDKWSRREHWRITV